VVKRPVLQALVPRHVQALALVLALVLAGSGFVAAGETSSGSLEETPQSLSLATARRIALEHNWDLLAAKCNVDLADAQRIIAHEFPNPSLSLSPQKINVDGRPSSTSAGNGLWDRSYDTFFAVNQLIEIGGKRGIRQKSANAGIDAARASLLDAKRQLDLGVSKAYLAVLLAEADMRILNETAKSLRKESDISSDRLKAGDMSESDRSQIEIAADRAELDAKAADAAAVSARVAVEVLLGERHPKGEWKATDSLEKLAGVDFAVADQKDVPASMRPDLVAAEAGLRKAEQDLLLQKAMRIPDPTFLVQYEHNPPDQPNSVGFGISIPLPIWNSNKGNIRAAEATRDQAATQIGKVQGQIASDIVSALAAQRDARARWKRYRDEVQPKSAKVLETIGYAYKKGGAPLVALLEAARTDNEVRLAGAQAMADSATAAVTLAAARNTLSNETQNTETRHEKFAH
jgi:outer membrane protein, heavy metal efflux system